MNSELKQLHYKSIIYLKIKKEMVYYELKTDLA
jgi:hypothetical protein